MSRPRCLHRSKFQERHPDYNLHSQWLLLEGISDRSKGARSCPHSLHWSVLSGREKLFRDGTFANLAWRQRSELLKRQLAGQRQCLCHGILGLRQSSKRQISYGQAQFDPVDELQFSLPPEFSQGIPSAQLTSVVSCSHNGRYKSILARVRGRKPDQEPIESQLWKWFSSNA